MFSDSIFKQPPGREKNPVIDFMPIQPQFFIRINKNDLSKDKQYLPHIVRAISIGFCNPELADENPGSISYFRWLSCDNRVLRLYVSQISPSTQMKKFDL